MKNVVLILLVAAHVCNAQPDSNSKRATEYGLVGGINFNSHHSSFSQLGNFPSCCPDFDGGSGWGPYAALFAALPLSNKWKFQARLSFSVESGTLEDTEQSFVADLRDSAKVVNATFLHTIDASLSSIGIEPYIVFNPFAAFEVLFGFRLGYVTHASFHQTEVLVEPADYGAYLGAGRVWVDTQADIPEASSIRATVGAGLRYSLPLNARGTWHLAPELFYHYALTSVASNVDWGINQMRGGISLIWTPQDEAEPVLMPVVLPVVIETPPPITLLRFVQYPSKEKDQNGKPIYADLHSIVIEDTTVIDQMPLLGHIYFDIGSSAIPLRYLYDVASTKERPNNVAAPNTPDAVLGIIVNRLKANPSAHIALTGCVSDVNGDKGADLAKNRADAVRYYFESNGIDASRISSSTRRLPAIPTKASVETDEEFANEENRRVEMTSDDPAILAPITIKSVRRKVAPEDLAVSYGIQSQAGISMAKGSIRSTDTTLSFVIDTSDQHHLINRISLLRTADVLHYNNGVINKKPIVAEMITEDTLHHISTASDTLTIVELTAEKKRIERIADVQIERYILILFPFDEASLTNEHLELLKMVRSRIVEGSSVKIIGMTDVMGQAEYNTELSRRRAKKVADALGITEYSIDAVGEASPNFNNTMPEGRAYNRTVIIEITSPVR